TIKTEDNKIVFGIDYNPAKDEAGAGTMSQSGATCPCCDTIMTSKDIRAEAISSGLGQVMTAVVVDGVKSKEYRLPTDEDLQVVQIAESKLDDLYSSIPFGIPNEPISKGGSRRGGGSPFTVHIYGLDTWAKLFTSRQLLTLGTFVKHTRNLVSK